ncbi:MAG: hypothetical protein QOF77_1758 [Solirubrobacteraceae bacterium]|nr:hypothetical protein [Solirubrobacteraceae bacterium]
MRPRRRGTGRVLAALLTLVLSLTLGGARAAAVIVHAGGDARTISIQPRHVAATPHRFDAFFSNLDYSGGPVMHANANYTFYWEPPTAPAAFPADYAAGIDRYFTDLAHDSGGDQNVESVAAQYGDGAGNAAYNSSFAGRLLDTTPYPVDGCPTTAEVPVCLTDDQIVAELGRYLIARGLPRDLTHAYYVLLPPTVGTCIDAAAADCSAAFGSAANATFCAYHSNSTTSPAFLYALDGYVTDNPGCDDGQHPNASTADGAIEGGLSHEHLEMVTDPFPASAWNDYVNGASTGTEIGDKCDPQTGPAIGTANGVPYNQLINGHPYRYQEEWSNQGHTCLQRFTPNATAVTASFTAQTGAGNTVNVDAGASTGATRFSWSYGEDPNNPTFHETTVPTDTFTFAAPGTYTIALTAFAPDGTSAPASLEVTADERPTGDFSLTTAAPTAGRPAAFTAAVEDPDGAISAYRWDFGDATAAGAGPAPSHTYASPGVFTVTLTATDSSGQSLTVAHAVAVDEPPAGDFTLTPAAPTAGQATAFSATAGDPDGAIAGYAWSFGDGSAPGAGPGPSHTYAAAGSYTATLTATDTDGATVTVSHQVVVSAPVTVPDEPPTGDFTVTTRSPAAGRPTLFSATAADPDGAISAFAWSFGDGSPAGSGPAPAHTYARSGTFKVTMTATDSSGAAVSVTHALAVAAAASTFHVIAVALAGDGTATIRVSLPSAGTIGAAQKRQAKPRPAQIRAVALTVKAPATVTLHITPTAAARRLLFARRTLAVNVLLTYAPLGGTPSAQTRTLRLRRGATAKKR